MSYEGRQFVQRVSSGGAFKNAVRCVTTGDVSLTGPNAASLYDGVTPSLDDRIGVVAQVDKTQNGIYTLGSSGQLVRSADFDSAEDVQLGTTFRVTDGLGNRGAIWTLDAPTSGSVSIGSTALEFSRLDTTAKNVAIVRPDDDPTGATFYARVNAIWAAGYDVETDEGGVYKTSAPLVPPSGRRIFCRNRCMIQKGSGFASGSADDRTNSVIRIAGASTGTVATTLAATAPMGSISLTMTSSTNIVADMWLKLEGNNAADLFNGQSDAEVVVELVQVASVVGPTVTLKSRTCMHHALNKPVVSYAPFIGDPTQPTVSGVYFDWSGPGTTGVGIEITNAVGVRISQVEGRGFTRSFINMKGAKNTVVEDPVSRGDNNGLVHVYTSQLVDVYRPRATGENGRVHSSGVPRPMLLVDDHPVGLTFRDARLHKVAGCVRWWGGILCGVDGLDAHDVDCSEIVARDTEMLASNPNGVMGSVLDGGPAELSYATFWFGNFMTNVRATAVTQPNISNQYAMYLHDGFWTTVANVQVQNKGNSASIAGSYLNGILLSDSDGVMTNVQVHAARIGFETRNFIDRYIVDGLFMNGSPGEGSQGVIGLLFDHPGGINTSPIFRTVRIANYANYFYFLTSWASAPDRALRIDQAEFDGFIGEKVYAVNYGAGPVGGTVLRLTGGSPEAVQESTGPSHRNIIAMGPSVNGWGLAAFGDAVAKHTGTAAVRGDLLEADAGGNLVVNNSPASALTARYRAVVASAGGYVNVQKVA